MESRAEESDKTSHRWCRYVCYLCGIEYDPFGEDSLLALTLSEWSPSEEHLRERGEGGVTQGNEDDDCITRCTVSAEH